MADLRPLMDATDAHAQLWAIPGVLRIGFGFKETAGEVLGEPALRVYVAAKRPAEELSPEESIPPEVCGIATDVVVLQERRFECKVRVHAGGKITREISNGSDQIGTLGCVVRRGGALFILSNEHVLVARSVGTTRYVWSPEPGSSGDRVAEEVADPPPIRYQERVVGGKTHALDCALAPIKPGVTCANDPGGTAMQPAVRDLSSEPLQPLAIHKMGATTGPSTGTLAEVSHQKNPAGDIVWELSVKPTGGTEYSETLTLAAAEGPLQAVVAKFAGEGIQATVVDAAQRRVRFQGHRFSDHGDSGSVWLDPGQRPVGLHSSSGHFPVSVEGRGVVQIPTGRGYACHLAAVFAAMGVDPANGILVGTTTTAGEPLAVPVVEPERLAALERSERGRELVAVVERHEEEVRTLIHHRRRVTVAWHRAGGPAFVAAGLRSRVAVPPEIAGHRLDRLVGEMLPVLLREGSPALREALRRDGELLVALAQRCTTLEDVAVQLQREPSHAAR